jgi:hypothetical protein
MPTNSTITSWSCDSPGRRRDAAAGGCLGDSHIVPDVADVPVQTYRYPPYAIPLYAPAGGCKAAPEALAGPGDGVYG